MKTNYADYVLSALCIGLVIFADAAALLISSAFLRSLFGEFFPVLVTLLFLGIYGILSAVVLRVITTLAPFRHGDFSSASGQFTLWKLHAVVGELGRAAAAVFFPVFLKPPFYALFGARIGKNVAIGGRIVDPLLTTLEDFAILGEGSIVVAHAMTPGRFFLKPVRICRGATVGVGAIVFPGVELGENSVLAAGSVATMDTRIPANEMWGGIPAKKIK